MTVQERHNRGERITRPTKDVFKYTLRDHKPKIGAFNDYDTFYDYQIAIMHLGELEDKVYGEVLQD